MLHKKQAKLREYIRELYRVQHVEKPFRPGGIVFTSIHIRHEFLHLFELVS